MSKLFKRYLSSLPWINVRLKQEQNIVHETKLNSNFQKIQLKNSINEDNLNRGLNF